jgi:hypothetical protein
MSKDTWIGRKGFRYYYYKYRDSEYFSLGLMTVTIVTCLVLIFNILIPQVNSWFSIRDEIIATRERIAILQENINFMNNLDRNALNNQLATATGVLPPEKDFGSMLNVLADASISSGVALNDFSFQVGNVASSSGLVNDSKHKNLASIKITVVALGSIENVKKYIETVEKSVPVSEVVNIDGSGQTVSLSILFFQKTLPQITLQADKKIEPLAAEKANLLQQLAAWRKAQPRATVTDPTASGGALPLF